VAYRIQIALGAWLATMIAGGAQCPRSFVWSEPAPPPPLLSPAPTLQEIMSVVNANAARVRSFTIQNATLSGSGFPNLQASIFAERPRRFRLRASHVLSSGAELDLGSNDELIWFWMRRSDPKEMYFCRHDQLAGSPIQRMLPMRPERIIDAFGLATFDPADSHQPPTPHGAGQLQIRSTIEGPEGPTTRVAIVDSRMGWILEQHLYDASGKHLASVRSSQYALDPTSAAYLPRHIELESPEAQMTLAIDIGYWQTNQLIGPQTWMKPEEPGYRNVDLANVGALPGRMPTSPAVNSRIASPPNDAARNYAPPNQSQQNYAPPNYAPATLAPQPGVPRVAPAAPLRGLPRY
jgi:hypothetical protein